MFCFIGRRKLTKNEEFRSAKNCTLVKHNLDTGDVRTLNQRHSILRYLSFWNYIITSHFIWSIYCICNPIAASGYFISDWVVFMNIDDKSDSRQQLHHYSTNLTPERGSIQVTTTTFP